MRIALLATILAFPLLAQNSAWFVKYDTTTSGSWKGVYGSTGFNSADDSCGPAFCSANGRGGLTIGAAQVTLTGELTYLWTASSDTRGLALAASAGNLAATWYGSLFTIDIVMADAARHQVALYSVDWDSFARSQSVTVLDYDTGAVLIPPMTLANYRNGAYLAWSITGRVRFQLTSVTGANAVVSGIFFDDPRTGATAPAPLIIQNGSQVQAIPCPPNYGGPRLPGGACMAAKP